MNYQDYIQGWSEQSQDRTALWGAWFLLSLAAVCCLWRTLSGEAVQTTGHASRGLREQAFGSGFVS